ncbi:MAG: hypothetical protein K0S76_897 [Herbinix sp.]|jgi:membrane protease YdiL (CAAX protease family)|nr:hypothetical protein [Herbinix sp.]
MKKLGKLFGSVLPFFAAVGIQYTLAIFFAFMYGILVSVIAGIKFGLSGVSDKDKIAQVIEGSLSMEILYVFSMIASLACGIVFFFWYRHLIRFEVRGSLKKLFTVKNLVLLILLGLGCQSFLTGFMSLIQPFFYDLFDDYADVVEQLMSGNIVTVVVYTIFMAPIVEELIFRGVILHKANKVIPFLGANILQAILFGIYHMNIVQGIYATIAGFLFGLMYYKFRNIYAPIMLHMIINASSFVIIYLPTGILPFVVAMLIGFALIVITIALLKMKENSIAQTYPGAVSGLDQVENLVN